MKSKVQKKRRIPKDITVTINKNNQPSELSTGLLERNNAVYVVNLDPQVTENDVRMVFEQYGKIDFVQIQPEYTKIEYYDYRDAEKALELNGQLADGRKLAVLLEEPVSIVGRAKEPQLYSDGRQQREPLEKRLRLSGRTRFSLFTTALTQAVKQRSYP